ncbi:hypothetical protein BGW80DRAFT_1330613 [Lactifluus volemus]|nr:hypothetical protein BGW80DRAFT_1330613 [Lactifluus volemus]
MLGLSHPHPHPGASFLFHNQTSADESLCCIALGSIPLGGTAGPGVTQKIIAVLLKDLDVFARDGIKDELASLDPLLRKVGGWGVPVGNSDEGRATYEFDPEH